MIIQVRPIEVKKWHGKTGNESFTRTKIIQALVDPETVAYQTGLTTEEEETFELTRQKLESFEALITKKINNFQSDLSTYLEQITAASKQTYIN